MIGIIASEMDWNVRELMREITVSGHDVAPFSITDFFTRVSGTPRVTSGEIIVDELKSVFVRWVSGGSAEQIIFRMDVLHRMENMGIPVINPSIAIERCADKYYTCSLLEDAGIPTPPTVCTEHYSEAMDAFEEMRDVVVKPIFGSQGMGIMRITDQDSAHRLFRILDHGRCVFYIQKFIPHANEDFRAFVVGDEVISSMKRRGTSWKTNFARGALVEPIQLPPNLEDMAVEASHVVGCTYSGVDILPGADHEYIIEVNSIPGWRGLQNVTDFCIAKRIVDYYL
ncbi:MAG: RimK family alpha-L-glutamate ligase [Theionarchaea archaeon]|nr:RimK family alpha-L-glutamate ligase [Theionarchaea archaeon]